MANECEYKAELLVIRQEFKELQAELDKHRWIPVSERLPKLVVDGKPETDKNKVRCCDIETGEIWDDYREDSNYGEQWSLAWTGRRQEPTHWQPIILPKG